MKGTEACGKRKKLRFGFFAATALLLCLALAGYWGRSFIRESGDPVARETIQESVKNLLVFYPPSCALYVGRGATQVTEGLKRDQRIGKLLDVIEHGSPQDIEALHGALMAVISVYLTALPLDQPIGEPMTATVMNPLGGNAIPMLLAAFPPSTEHLCLLVAMANRTDEAFEHFLRAWPQDGPFPKPQKLSSETTMLLAYNADKILSGLADGKAGQESYSAEQCAALEAYVQYRSEQRALAGEFVARLVKAGLGEPEGSKAMQSMLSLLDSMRWDDPFGMPSGDTDTFHNQERETMVFARRMCCGATTQTPDERNVVGEDITQGDQK